jgi:hypothetical protein
VDAHLVVGEGESAVNVIADNKHSNKPTPSGGSRSYSGAPGSFKNAALSENQQLVTNICKARRAGTLDAVTARSAVQNARDGLVLREIGISGYNTQVSPVTLAETQASVTKFDQFADATAHRQSMQVREALKTAGKPSTPSPVTPKVSAPAPPAAAAASELKVATAAASETRVTSSAATVAHAEFKAGAGLARREASLVGRAAGSTASVAVKGLIVANVYFAIEDYKEGLKYGQYFAIMNLAGSLVGMSGAGTVMGQAKDLPPADPVKLMRAVVTSNASAQSIGMGWLHGQFR